MIVNVYLIEYIFDDGGSVYPSQASAQETRCVNNLSDLYNVRIAQKQRHGEKRGKHWKKKV